MKFETGTEMNFSGRKAEGLFELFGDPTKLPEKPLTVVKFPGGHVEISRTSDDEYWIHVAVNAPHRTGNTPDDKSGSIVDMRVDTDKRGILHEPSMVGDDISHIAFRVVPK